MPGTDHPGARSGIRVMIVGLAVALLLSSCTLPGSSKVTSTPLPSQVTAPPGVHDPALDPALKAFYTQAVSWKDCGNGFQCASIAVPLDWKKPAGARITVAFTRLPASGHKLGSLLINPGGPGASGIEYAQAAKQVFGKAVLKNYDIVGFDPRGVGASTAVKCLPDSQLDAFTAADATPDDQAELDASIISLKDFATACEQNTGPLIDHVDTLSVVRDLDVLRAVLGDDVLSYQGASYGTYIGAWYAQTFPWRVGRMVLDGAVDPTLTSKQYLAGQAEGFSRALKAFVANCQSSSGCPLTGSLQNGLNQVGALVQKSDSAPLPTSDPKRPLTQSLMVTGIAQALYAEQLWPTLKAALKGADKGNGSGLLALADTYLERDAQGHYGQTISANPAIFCLDVPENRTPQQISADSAELERQYPPLGGTIGWGALGCAEWPLPGVMPREKLTAVGAAPILVLGTVGDPATPYEWAQALSSQLSSGRLLTWEGTMHTAYHQGSSCVDDKVEAYLLTGGVPAAGTRCT